MRVAQANAEFAVNLVPSENILSPLARLPLSTDFHNRYFFNQSLDPAFWQFRGGQGVAQIETEAADCLADLAHAPYANVRPTSGMSAMMIAMAALGGEPGGIVVSIDARSGGHYATEGVARRLGFEALTVSVSRGRVDDSQLVRILRDREPRLIYLDLQNSRHELNVRRVSDLIKVHSPHTNLHVDCSHTMGLILGGALRNPLDDGADTMGGSTHKSFPGPHKGVLFTRSVGLHQLLAKAQMAMLSTHHFADTLALGLAALEFSEFGNAYARQVILNAQFLGDSLAAAGFHVVTDDDGHVTDTHQVWVKIGDADQTDQLSRSLYAHGIRVNVQIDLPGVPGPIFRLGLSEMTFLGAREDAVRALVAEFVSARSNTHRDGLGSRRIRAACGEPFYFEKLW